MAAKVVITVPSPDDILTGYSSGAKLRIQSASSESGSFADLASPTVAVVAATYQYEVWDAAGDGTTWYRWRPENSGGTETGDWSAAFQGLEAAAAARNAGSYASMDDLLLAVATVPGETRRLARYEKVLVEAREMLDAELGGHDAFRHPQTGTQTWLFHGRGGNLLHVHRGIVTCTLVELRLTTNGDWVALDADDWWLEADTPGELEPRSGEPYFHLRLSDAGTYTTFPIGENRIRLTAALGWARPSGRHVEANLAWARQIIAADPSFPGGVSGPTELGSPVGTQRLPDAVWRLARREADRFTCAI